MADDPKPNEPQGDPPVTPPPGDPPKTYAGKYKSPEELETAYVELQKKLGQTGKKPAAPVADPTDPLAAPPAPQIAEDTDFRGLVTAAGYDPADVFTKWSAGDNLDKFYDDLSKATNLPKGFVKQTAGVVFAAEKNTAEQVRGVVHEIAGGEQQWSVLRDWANANIPKDELDGYRAQMKNPKTAKIAARMIMQQHQEAVGAGNARPLASGGVAPNTGGGFSDFKDYAAGMDLWQRGKADAATIAKLRNTPRDVIERANRPG